MFTITFYSIFLWTEVLASQDSSTKGNIILAFMIILFFKPEVILVKLPKHS